MNIKACIVKFTSKGKTWYPNHFYIEYSYILVRLVWFRFIAIIHAGVDRLNISLRNAVANFCTLKYCWRSSRVNWEAMEWILNADFEMQQHMQTELENRAVIFNF